MKSLYYLSALLPLSLFALPSGGVVREGSASFYEVDKDFLQITASDGAILEYERFNIGRDERVAFVLPGARSVVLNRVQGGDPSAILGQLSGNGRIFLVNPYGVYFGPDATVDVGTLIASTLDICNEDFKRGAFRFFLKPGTLQASILNEGILTASPEGAIVLLSPFIQNAGTILADVGKVVLATAEKVTLDFSGDGLMSFALEGDCAAQSGHQICYAMKDAGCLVRNMVNDDGLIEAACMVEEGGVVRLMPSSKIHADAVMMRAAKAQVEGEVIAKKDLHLQAEQVLVLRDRGDQPLILQAYGTCTLKSSFLDIASWQHPDTSFSSGGDMTFISENPISADGRFFSGGNFSLLTPSGRAGDFTGLFDPIIIASGSVTFGNYDGVSLKVQAAESITCKGTITITGPDVSACAGDCSSDPDCSLLESQPALILVAGTPSSLSLCNPVPPDVTAGGATFSASSQTGSTITLGGDITGTESAIFRGDVILAGDITLSSISGGTVTFSGTIEGRGKGFGSLTLNVTGGTVTFGDSVGVASALKMLSVESASINFQGSTYFADSQSYTADFFTFSAPFLVTLESSLGGIFFDTGVLDISGGADLFVETNGGDFSFPSLEMGLSQSLNVLAESGTVTVGSITRGNGILIAGGNVLLNGGIDCNDLIVAAECSIQNGEAPGTITTVANQAYNVLKGKIGRSSSPIHINAGMLVFAGTPSERAVFSGRTADGTIHPLPSNTPCPLIFNHITLIQCPPSRSHPRHHHPKIPARDWYVPGIYSQYNSLASDVYFLPEVVTNDYTRPKAAVLFAAKERRPPFVLPPRIVDHNVEKPSNRNASQQTTGM